MSRELQYNKENSKNIDLSQIEYNHTYKIYLPSTGWFRMCGTCAMITLVIMLMDAPRMAQTYTSDLITASGLLMYFFLIGINLILDEILSIVLNKKVIISKSNIRVAEKSINYTSGNRCIRIVYPEDIIVPFICSVRLTHPNVTYVIIFKDGNSEKSVAVLDRKHTLRKLVNQTTSCIQIQEE